MADLHHLRPAAVSDAEAIARVHVLSWRETYSGILPESVIAAQDVGALTRFWSEVISGGSGCVGEAIFVAENAEGTVVGFSAMCRQRDADLAAKGYDAELAAIYLLRAEQQCGTGRALLARTMEAARASGYRAMALWVLDENAPTRAFYARQGGAIIAEKTEAYRGTTIHELAYGWTLSGTPV